MLPPWLNDKLAVMDARLTDIERQMAASPEQSAWQTLTEEYGKLLPLTEKFRHWCETRRRIGELDAMDDPELAELAAEERAQLAASAAAQAAELCRLAVPDSTDNTRNCFLEIRAAAGGNESCLFAADLFRMYCRCAEIRNWRAETVSASEGEVGGYKEIISRISGGGVYGALRHESGAHRVQRVPHTESQGRVHTSVVTVAVMPEARAEDNINIAPADLRVETFRSSGAGGQHVNTTDSAVRITHLPTNTVVECQDDRSQHKNRARAMSVLKARIIAAKLHARQQQEAVERKQLVGSGDRSGRIRTYNFPQGRLTDHRLGLTLYKLAAVMEGDLTEVLDALASASARGELL